MVPPRETDLRVIGSAEPLTSYADRRSMPNEFVKISTFSTHLRAVSSVPFGIAVSHSASRNASR